MHVNVPAKLLRLIVYRPDRRNYHMCSLCPDLIPTKSTVLFVDFISMSGYRIWLTHKALPTKAAGTASPGCCTDCLQDTDRLITYHAG